MAEVVGLIASIITILQLSRNTVRTLSGFAKDIERFEKGIKRLCNKVEICRRVLTRLSDKLHATATARQPHRSERKVGEVSQTLYEDLECALANTSDVFQGIKQACDAARKGTRAPKVFRKTKYSLFDKAQVEALSVELSQCFVELNLIMTIHWQDSHIRTQQEVVEALAKHISFLKASAAPSIADALRDTMARIRSASPAHLGPRFSSTRCPASETPAKKVEDEENRQQQDFAFRQANDMDSSSQLSSSTLSRYQSSGRTTFVDRQRAYASSFFPLRWKTRKQGNDTSWLTPNKHRYFATSFAPTDLASSQSGISFESEDTEALDKDQKRPDISIIRNRSTTSIAKPVLWRARRVVHLDNIGWEFEYRRPFRSKKQLGDPLMGLDLLNALRGMSSSAISALEAHLASESLALLAVKPCFRGKYLFQKKRIDFITRPYAGMEQLPALRQKAREEEDREMFDTQQGSPDYDTPRAHFVRTTVFKEKERVHKVQPHRRQSVDEPPTFPILHRDDIEIETLKHFDIPWELDSRDKNFIVLREELSHDDTDVLFAHTKRVKQRREKQAAYARMSADEPDSMSVPSRRESPADNRDGIALSQDKTSQGQQKGREHLANIRNFNADTDDNALMLRDYDMEIALFRQDGSDYDAELEERVLLNEAAEDLIQRLKQRWSMPGLPLDRDQDDSQSVSTVSDWEEDCSDSGSSDVLSYQKPRNDNEENKVSNGMDDHRGSDEMALIAKDVWGEQQWHIKR
ncbi:MAG: hypothetical protein Q9162_006957 [Coniocarpon cinnabarinum]